MTRRELVLKARQFLFKRQYAYQQVFNRNNVYLEIVLRDLARFCRAHDSTFRPDAREAAMLDGRRQVWLRIQRYMELTPEEIWELQGEQL